MKFIATTAALVSLVPGIVGLMVNTPTGVVQCQPILITYEGGTAPYYLTVIPGGQVSGTPLKTWDASSATSITWNVDIASGTSISLAVKDSTGAQAYSDQITIQSSGDSSCMNGSSSGTSLSTDSSTSTGPATPPAGVTSATGAATTGTTSRAAATSAVTSHVSSQASGASSRTTTATQGSTSGASSASSGAFSFDAGSFSIAGAFGLVGALLF